MAAILTLDYSHLTSDNEEQRQKFIHQILESFTTTGFVKIINHGFDEQQLKDLFEWTHTFFAQPLEVKNEIKNTTNPHRGYTAYGIESVSQLSQDEKIRAMKDSKEHFDQGPQFDKEYPNKWPKGLPAFRTFMEAFYEQCDKICLELVDALEVGLGINDKSITNRCTPSATDLRLTHYPPIPVEELKSGRRIRIAPHVDFGVISLLFQDGVGGLEAEDRTGVEAGYFVPIMPSNHTEMIVNLGATMQRWTNDKLFGGVHRVTVPPLLKKSNNAVIPARLSVAYLFKADRKISVGPLPAFVSEKEPARYPEMNALDYHQMQNRSIY